MKRGVRFAEDEKEDVIPLGYVLRMKRKREEKAKFLRAEHDRRVRIGKRTQGMGEREKGSGGEKAKDVPGRGHCCEAQEGSR